jgi:hypothetical protein
LATLYILFLSIFDLIFCYFPFIQTISSLMPQITDTMRTGMPAQGFPLASRGDASALPVEYVAYMAQPLLRILNGVKVHTACEGTSAHKVHTTFHMSLLPACYPRHLPLAGNIAFVPLKQEA